MAVTKVGKHEDIEEEIHDNFPFVQDLQHSIIRLMLEDHEFGRQCAFYLQPTYFSNYRVGWFVKFVQQYFDLYDSIPSLSVIRTELTKFDAEERVPYDLLFDNILQSDVSCADYIKNELTTFIRKASFKRKHEDIRQTFNNGSIDDTMEMMESTVEEMHKVDFKRDQIYNFADLWSTFAEVEEELKHHIPLGVPPIDQALNGGLAKKRVLLWIGGTNCGKSVILVNCAINFIKAGYKVLYVDFENDRADVVRRMTACYTGIQFNRLARAKPRYGETEIKKIEEAALVLKERLQLKMMHEYDCNVEDFVAYIERKKEQADFDVLIIDYAQFLKTKRKYDSKYTEHGEVYRILSLLALRKDIAIVTAAQGNRSAQKKNRKAKNVEALMTVEDIADSFEVIRKSAIILTITRSKKMEQDDEIVFLLDKQRQGRTNIAVKFKTEFDCIRVFNKDMKWELYGDDAPTELEEYDGTV